MCWRHNQEVHPGTVCARVTSFRHKCNILQSDGIKHCIDTAWAVFSTEQIKLTHPNFQMLYSSLPTSVLSLALTYASKHLPLIRPKLRASEERIQEVNKACWVLDHNTRLDLRHELSLWDVGLRPSSNPSPNPSAFVPISWFFFLAVRGWTILHNYHGKIKKGETWTHLLFSSYRF